MKTTKGNLTARVKSCSDSSMVDENCSGPVLYLPGSWFRFLYGRWKRCTFDPTGTYLAGSDSSMVDENHLEVELRGYSCLFRFLYGRWKRYGWRWSRFKCWVQIPLWSMKTFSFYNSSFSPLSSDSSMVDENVPSPHLSLFPQMFRFLYGRWKLVRRGLMWDLMRSSDSSMVDENPREI